MIGWAVRQLMIWGGVGLVLYAFVANRVPTRETAPAAAPVVSTPAAPAPQARAAYINSQVFRAGSAGHVVIDANVNGAPVKFLVDTGATMVVLTKHDAAAAGLNNLEFTMRTSTANGVARAAPATLREVRIRDLAAEDV